MTKINVSIQQKFDTYERKFIWVLRTNAGYPLDGIILSVKSLRDAESNLREYNHRRKQGGLVALKNSCLS